jgi:hypothetical protein
VRAEARIYFFISKSGADEVRIGVNYIFTRKKSPCGKAKSQYGN